MTDMLKINELSQKEQDDLPEGTIVTQDGTVLVPDDENPDFVLAPDGNLYATEEFADELDAADADDDYGQEGDFDYEGDEYSEESDYDNEPGEWGM